MIWSFWIEPKYVELKIVHKTKRLPCQSLFLRVQIKRANPWTFTNNHALSSFKHMSMRMQNLCTIQFENSIIEFCIVPYSICTRLYWMKIPSNQNNFGDKVLHANADYSVWNEMGSFEVLYHFSLVDYKVISIVSR